MSYRDQRFNYTVDEARMLKMQSLAGVSNLHARVFQLLIDKLIDKQYEMSKGKKVLWGNMQSPIGDWYPPQYNRQQWAEVDPSDPNRYRTFFLVRDHNARRDRIYGETNWVTGVVPNTIKIIHPMRLMKIRNGSSYGGMIWDDFIPEMIGHWSMTKLWWEVLVHGWISMRIVHHILINWRNRSEMYWMTINERCTIEVWTYVNDAAARKEGRDDP